MDELDDVPLPYLSNLLCRDQQIYEQKISAGGASEPKRITDPDAKLRFADGVVDAARKRLIAVQEDHSGEGEAVNTVAAVGGSLGAHALP